MYGTRDAALAWEENYAEWLTGELNFNRSMACQNAFHHKGRAIRIIVHGDDFLMAGPERELMKLKGQMDRTYEAKHLMIWANRRTCQVDEGVEA